MPEAALPAVSELLAKWGAGDREAFCALIPLLYDELHHVAHRYLRKARPGHTLQTTALVHEAFLRLDQHHHARRAGKRGTGGEHLTLDDAHAVMKGRPVDLIALDDALNDLARLDPQQSHIVVHSPAMATP